MFLGHPGDINSLFQQFPRRHVLREGRVPDRDGKQGLEHRVDDEHPLLLPGVRLEADVPLQRPGVVEVEPSRSLGDLNCIDQSEDSILVRDLSRPISDKIQRTNRSKEN